MKLLQATIFLLIFTTAFSQTQTIQLFSAATLIGSPSGSLAGSLRGGTTIYINGLGFPTDPRQINVFVGTYPCIIPADGSTATVLSCMTTDSNSNADISGLKIQVISSGQSYTVPSTTFAYKAANTPLISEVFPSAAIPGTQLNYYARHRILNAGDGIRDMGDVLGIYVGNSLCSMFDITQGSISYNGISNLICNSNPEQEGGKYNVTQHVVAGRANKYYTMRKPSLVNEWYEQAVLPAVSSLSPNLGFTSGQSISIKGKGFSVDPNNIQVSIDNVNCQVTGSTLYTIDCQLQPKVNQTSQIASNAATKTNQYISGSGFKYTRYDIRGLATQTVSGLRTALANNVALPVLETGVQATLEAQNVYGEGYAQVWKGYFFAPNTGVYTFQGAGDDIFSLYMSSTYGSTAGTLSQIIYATSYQNYMDSYYLDNVTTATKTVNLEGGNYYYTQLYHLNTAGTGFVKVSVQVPNNDTTLQKQTFQVDFIQTTVTNDPQILQFTLAGASGGKFNISIVRTNLGLVSYFNTIELNYNAGCTEFVNALNQFDIFSSSWTSCINVTAYDANDVATTMNAGVKYVWFVQVGKVRTTAQVNQKFKWRFDNLVNVTGATQTFTQVQVSPHGPVLSGTFTLQFGASQVMIYNSTTATYSNPNIPFNVTASTLQSALTQFQPFVNCQVNFAGTPEYGGKWIISFIQNFAPIPTPTISGSGLSGGKAGTIPSITFNVARPYSSSIFFNPVSQTLLFTAAALPQVIVTVRGVTSACVGDCSFTFLSSTPYIAYQQLVNAEGSLVKVDIVDPANLTYPTSDLTVTINNVVCSITAGTYQQFNCTLPTNSDNSPTIQAGSYDVQVYVNGKGYIKVQSNVTQLDFPLDIVSVAPPTGGVNGGYPIVINGHGFPFDASTITLTLCNMPVKVTQIFNDKIYAIAPACTAGTQTIQLNYNQRSANVNFTYTAITPQSTILSISPTSFSPAQKGVMTIQGTGFGSNIADIQVFLANDTGKVYGMRVLSLFNGTQITCGIPGGIAGTYAVQVTVAGHGDSTPLNNSNVFIYELVVESISPRTGSNNGGTLVTITGKNFATDVLETIISVGDYLNTLCIPQTINQTQITCRTPPSNPRWSTLQQNFIVTNRIIADSSCGGDCSFTYLAPGASPALTSVSLSSVGTNKISLILTGTNFPTTVLADVRVVLQNNLTSALTIVTPTTVTASNVNFTVPNIDSGAYFVRIRFQPVGETNSLALTLTSAFSPTSYTGSVNGGSMVLTGSGFPSKWPAQLFTMTSTANSLPALVNVLSINSSRIELAVPPGADGTKYTISLTNPSGTPISATFTQSLASTPVVTLVTSSPVAAGSVNIKLNRITYLTTTNPTNISIFNVLNPSVAYAVPSWTYNGTYINFSYNFPAGSYGFKLFYSGLGWATCTSVINVSAAAAYTLDAPNTVSSYAGSELIVKGAAISPQAVIQIGGFVGKVVRQNADNATFAIPPFIVPDVTALHPVLKKSVQIKPATIISDGGSNPAASFDSLHATFYSSTNAACYIGLDVGANKVANVNRIRYFPNYSWTIAAKYLNGAVFQASNDGTAYTQIGRVDQTVHAGWNSLQVKATTNYRYFRLKHTSTSGCKIVQLQFYGTVYNSLTVSNIASFSTPIRFNDGYNTYTFNNAVTYSSTMTPVVDTVSPNNGTIYGGTTITITGSYLNIGTPVVVIDSIPCVVSAPSITATSFTCVTGQRLDMPSVNTFDVTLGSHKAILNDKFEYVMRWSDIRTWGTDLPPVEGDLVYVPQGMTLLVDQDTPILAGIVVENGKLIFADEKDMTISTYLITLNGGEFRAGTEDKPYQHKLTFVMYGSYYGKQQPMFGNKGIGCMNCKFSMYGIPRPYTWSVITSTIAINSNTLTVRDPVDWQVGEQIVVASTDFDHNQAEQRTITAITGSTITVDRPFNYKHFSGVQTYGTKTLEMRAQVGLLTRNIKMMGDPTSDAGMYGSHLMLTGSGDAGLVGHVAYTEFTQCGQPRIVGRYCMHFHMAGDVPDSYVLGNAVHHSHARVLTLHGVHFLTASHNVGYYVKGHNFFVQDGIETDNTIQYNLIISSLTTFNMMQTDISVASYWVTNPSNTLRYNHAAGGDFYGFWYEIKQHPDGPSATLDVCPIGNPLGESHDNVAHSYVRFGLRIFKLYSRTYPCEPIRDDTLVDPWANNPSIQSVFSNYTIYKVGESGLLAEQCGNVIFDNFTIAEFQRSGIQFYVTNFTKQLVVAKNMAIIGLTSGNANSTTSLYQTARGAIGPRTSGWKMSNINFYNMPSYMTILQTCSNCDNLLLYTNTGGEYFVDGITYTNVSAKYLHMMGMQRQIIYDTDGSYSKNFDSIVRTSATITAGFKHLANDVACKVPTVGSQWNNNNAVACDQTAIVRKVMFTNLAVQSVFTRKGLKAQLITDASVSVSNTSTSFTQIYSLQGGMQPKKDKPQSYSMAYIAGRTYNIWWLTGLDFTHLAMDISKLFKDTDPAIIFKFNYTENRELFEIGEFNNMKMQLPLSSPTINASLDNSVCNFGDYTHDNTARALTLCASSRQKSMLYEYLDVNGIKCRYLCPNPNTNFVKQPFVRVWSNVTQWPNGRLPADGDNITIPGPWTIIMDMNPAIINFWMIDGDVIIPPTLPIAYIVANSVWVRLGSIKAGTSTSPYPGDLTFQIRGNKTDVGFTINADVAGTKLFVVTGVLQLYGKAPSTVWTPLTSIIRPGSVSLTVASTAGWKVGDQIAIAPSFNSPTQFQFVTITSVNSATNVSFSPALNFTHYGASSATINNAIGTLDTRAAVGHVTRNIKFISGDDDGWGYQVIFNGYLDNNLLLHSGSGVLSGVQFFNGGQYDTENTVLKLLNTVGTNAITITASSFYNCKSFCMDINTINNALIKNNVFFNARLFHVRALALQNFTFTNNLMIGAIKRPSATMDQLIACYATYDDITNNHNYITNNLCQGSAGHGFVLPYITCDLLATPPYANNTAGSTPIGFIFNKIPGSCMAVTGIKAYACNIGQIAGSFGISTLIFENFMVTDSGRGVTLRFGLEGDNLTTFFRNSYVSAISRPTCTECYGANAIDCTDNHGVRMFTASVNGQHLPAKFGAGFDVVCKQQSFDCKAFLTNIIFQNFLQTYPTLPQCSANVIFKPHSGATDLTGSHHLHGVVCNNCALNAMAYFSPPNPREFGWSGGCGNLLCTGKNNYLIHDHTGDLLGAPGILLANNSVIGDNTEGCTYIPEINGHYCQRQDLAVLEYESIAPDFNTRIMWPVYLQFDGGLWNSTTNGWKEWDWLGNQPQNHRLGRFVSVIQINQIYNMTFQSQPPSDMRLQFQARSQTGNNAEWIIVKLYYPLPNSIRVSNRGGVVEPISLLDNSTEKNLNVSLCGSNKFFYQNYTIHFVITADASCQVRVTVTNSIQLNARLQMDINQFFNLDGITLFRDRMCAVLGINDTSRLKVVGVYRGSVEITAFIEESQTTTTANASSSQPSVGAQEINALNEKIKSLSSSGALNTALTSTDANGKSLGSLTSLGTTLFYIEPQAKQDNKQQMSQNKKMIIGLAVGITVGVIILVGVLGASFTYFSRKRARIEDAIQMDEPSELKQFDHKPTKIQQNESVVNFESKK